MKIAIGCDHAGFELKEKLVGWIKARGSDPLDMGAFSNDSVDYPDFAHTVSEKVSSGEATLGILICGSGNGVCMTANKHKDIRAALAWNAEIAALARQHNNANILCLPARFISEEEAQDIVNAYLDAGFEGGRHQRRVDKISC
jgi:ribose 5-phosphate isomerase B